MVTCHKDVQIDSHHQRRSPDQRSASRRGRHPENKSLCGSGLTLNKSLSQASIVLGAASRRYQKSEKGEEQLSVRERVGRDSP